MAVLPYLFLNSECWTEISKKSLNMLESIQNTFFRSLFSSCKGSPIPAFYWDTGILLVDNFIIQKKLFLHHISNLPDNSLAFQVLQMQKENSWPGLFKECKELLEELDIDVEPSMVTKSEWKKLIKTKIHDKNKRDLLEKVKGYKKSSWKTGFRKNTE